MTGHAHEGAPQGATAVPEPIRPEVEALVHRRATEVAAERPRRRLAMASGMGGIAIASVCAVLLLVLGSSSGGGLLSPRQAVAAAVQSLEGDGILHWVYRGDLIESPEQQDRPGAIVAEEWVDLSNGHTHRSATVYPVDGEPYPATERWTASGFEWIAPTSAGDEALTPSARQERRLGPMLTVVESVQELLERAENGELEVDSASAEDDRPLVVVAERMESIERRVWLTREAQPKVVRLETTVASRNAPRPIVVTTTTETWEILPRTAEALTHVQVPRTATPIP